ncbi:hypothetical protein [Primorskyibacter sp. 2E233]|uniref:hypothetical protein n=1 Tax=Primorskyibacter sp. 2E233 TaxID=3413431 RepID=UPI003BF05A38
MMIRAAGLSLVAMSPSFAQEPEPLPSFSECMDAEAARFERALNRHLTGPEADSFEIGDTHGVEYCGTLGIVSCDRSETPLACQHALGAQQDVLSDKVRAALPTPETLVGRGEEPLYAALYALALGQWAEPDCAGNTPVMEAWCQAREANRRLINAVSAWQLARYLDAVPDAFSAGWAQVPPPTRPRARAGKDKE